jgi:phosphinothricin acetyltransferase
MKATMRRPSHTPVDDAPAYRAAHRLCGDRYGATVTPTIRPARLDDAGLAADAAACAAIYAPYVTGTATSFEDVPPSPEEMARRISAAAATHAWLVAERPDGELLGYAYGTPFRARPAYRWSTEVSVYLAVEAPRRAGAGRALYDSLLAMLTARGYHRAFAGVALPNDASVALHRAVGFEEVGVERRVGFKLGAWHDVLRMQLDLVPATDDPPADPR